jgi:hypothetical protein
MFADGLKHPTTTNDARNADAMSLPTALSSGAIE